MNGDVARAYAASMTSDKGASRVRVSIQLNTGTHHTLALLESTGEDGLKEVWRESFPTRMEAVELDAPVGGIVHQRTTSPASAEVLERYGVVLGDGILDWGTDADWVVDFGPVGDATRRGLRSPTASFNVKRGRTFAPSGDEVAGGAVEGTPTTSTD
ncbi:Hypothetical Protein RradSPS_2029 [Rubrobacter radiotolerans]|uniref:Uncharacterized protein n=1 Tax=Rubrobacter radiotolerans TaxID=42256 RepID=A0A023X4B3_RUBRA|nr:hypothetical protein [Rubrobacter radiotolerans]AHY47312.1 Hypothetical Protein RradSPS_2029 [Rubrobacter radiotolerans]MDX5894716.1 hypothetical protein [Rubrobacter radiotolerans]SMC06598.1 hypothetical protein SAMN00767673_2031 [Rubrobacter radiotolerans DSM 5868]